MFKRSKESQSTGREEIVDAVVASANFGGDFTVFVGHESIGPGVGMSPEDSRRYAEVTRRAIYELYPELRSKTNPQESDS